MIENREKLVRYFFSHNGASKAFARQLESNNIPCLSCGHFVQLTGSVESKHGSIIDTAILAVIGKWQFVNCTEERYAWEYMSHLDKSDYTYVSIFYETNTVLILEQGNNPEDWDMRGV